jgi:hypothetical protein
MVVSLLLVDPYTKSKIVLPAPLAPEMTVYKKEFRKTDYEINFRSSGLLINLLRSLQSVLM